MPAHPFPDYRDTPLWSAVEETLTELIATHEVTVNTATEYVIGYLCQELIAKRLVLPAGSQP